MTWLRTLASGRSSGLGASGGKRTPQAPGRTGGDPSQGRFGSETFAEEPSDATHSEGVRKKGHLMGYGIGGILITILVILAIIYFAKRV